MDKKLKIAVITSGGDSPGMNAAIRAITLACLQHHYQCLGFFHGYNGLLDEHYIELTDELVNSHLQHGGTLLKSARCKAMLEPEGPKQVANTLLKLDIDTLIVIGGDGSFRGMLAIAEHWDGQLIGLPGTIDNDLAYCDKTIGFATAVQTATDAIDKIRDTADAFERVFIVEVMGRHSGHIAFSVGLATGAEAILSFENFSEQHKTQLVETLSAQIKTQQQNKHSSFLIVLAENLWPGGASELQKALKQHSNIETGLCVLGHIQRGGSPVVEDRLLASRLGLAAVDLIHTKRNLVMLGEVAGTLTTTEIEKTVTDHKPVAQYWLDAHATTLKGFNH